jgi:hypothetical protein
VGTPACRAVRLVGGIERDDGCEDACCDSEQRDSVTTVVAVTDVRLAVAAVGDDDAGFGQVVDHSAASFESDPVAAPGGDVAECSGGEGELWFG